MKKSRIMTLKFDNTVNNMTSQFAFQAVGVNPDNIDRDDGRITSVSVISTGPAIGHGTYVDAKSLSMVLEAIEDDKVPAYITHRGAIFDDRLTREIGYFHNYRMDGDCVRADFQAFESFRKDDERKYNRLFELAETMPNRFGLSIVFKAGLAWATTDGDVEFTADKDQPENALYPHPSLRPTEINSADFVDSPAANPRGLFSKIDKPGKTMTKAELETLSQDLQKDKVELTATLDSLEVEKNEMKEQLDTSKAEIETYKAKLTETAGQRDEIQASYEEASGKLAASEAALTEKTEQLDTQAAEMERLTDELGSKSKRVDELEALLKGTAPIENQHAGGSESKPTRAERDALVREYAEQNKCTEAQAVIKLSREKPELWA